MIGAGFVTAVMGDWVRKLAIGLAVAALLAGLGAGTVWYFVADKFARQKAAVATANGTIQRLREQAALDALIMARFRVKSAAAAASAAANRQILTEALGAARTWADEKVPEEVYRALQ